MPSPRNSGRTAPDSAARLGRFGARAKGDDGNFLVIPDSRAPYFDGTPIPVLGGITFAPGAHGLFLPAKALAPAQPIDLISTYITYEEVFGRHPHAAYVVDALERVERDTFVTDVARLLGAYQAITAPRRELDLALANY